MRGLDVLLRALGLHPGSDFIRQIDQLRASVKSLTRDVSQLRRSVSAISSDFVVSRRQLDQLQVLVSLERHSLSELQRLETILDSEQMGAHVRRVLMAADVMAAPMPHVAVRNFLPEQLYRAVADAIPPDILFGAPDAGEVGVPPPMATTASTVTWTFVAALMADAAVPVLREKFAPILAASLRNHAAAPPLGSPELVLSAGKGRLVRRRPDIEAADARPSPYHVLTASLCLARRGDITGHEVAPGAGDMSFEPNLFVVVAGDDTSSAYVPFPQDATPGVELYVYEYPMLLLPRVARHVEANER